MTDDSAENRKYISAVLDTFSVPNFYIRKGRLHGHKYGKAPGCKEYHMVNQLTRKCRKWPIHPRQNLREKRWLNLDSLERGELRHDADKASTWLQGSAVYIASPQEAEDKAYYQNWSQSSSLWWQWQTSWWHPSFETSSRRWTWHWSNGETWEVSETSIYVWHESHKEFGAKITVIISVTVNAVHRHRREM